MSTQSPCPGTDSDGAEMKLALPWNRRGSTSAAVAVVEAPVAPAAAAARCAETNAAAAGSAGRSSSATPGTLMIAAGTEPAATSSQSPAVGSVAGDMASVCNSTACSVHVRTIASPSALPLALHSDSDPGHPGNWRSESALALGSNSAKVASEAPQPGHHTDRAGSMTARSSALGTRQVSRPSIDAPQPLRASHAVRDSGCRANATAHARGACAISCGRATGSVVLPSPRSVPCVGICGWSLEAEAGSSTTSGEDRTCSARHAMSSGTTSASSSGSNATHSSCTLLS
mmetsp:Transcript_23319/g.57774  ORF Transcript_23319/g.57774 Transcript_23319/m.57774 type:complete len:287 (+) Transcript_23319:240-1100(+)